MTTLTSAPAESALPPRLAYPPPTPAFEWVFVGLAALLVTGLFVDAWAHFHGQTDNSFFTPWHALFYSAYALVALFNAGALYQGVSRGYAWARALPRGYDVALAGVVVFGLGGLGDMLWHISFGVEQGTEALLSPTHLLLALGMGLVAFAPVRAALLRQGQPTGWRSFGPVIIGAGLILLLLRFFTGYGNPVLMPLAADVPDFRRVRAPFTMGDMGATALLLEALLIGGVILPLVRRWRLPFGALTLILGGSTAALTVLTDSFFFIPAGVVAGLALDGLLRFLRPGARELHWRAFACAVPVVYFSLYLLTVELAAGIAWRVHVWAGAVTVAGIGSVLLSYLLPTARTKPEAAP
jgi:hypothetical protein